MNKTKDNISKIACKKMIKILLGVIVIIVIINILKKMPYETRYFEKFGANKLNYTYNDMIETYGDYQEVRFYESGAAQYVYKDFAMTYYTESPDSYLTFIRVLSNKYRFGWRSIGVGSTKKQVEAAYHNAPKSSDTPNAYIDKGMWVEFFYDETDVVKEIEFYYYGVFTIYKF